MSAKTFQHEAIRQSMRVWQFLSECKKVNAIAAIIHFHHCGTFIPVLYTLSLECVPEYCCLQTCSTDPYAQRERNYEHISTYRIN